MDFSVYAVPYVSCNMMSIQFELTTPDLRMASLTNWHQMRHLDYFPPKSKCTFRGMTCNHSSTRSLGVSWYLSLPIHRNEFRNICSCRDSVRTLATVAFDTILSHIWSIIPGIPKFLNVCNVNRREICCEVIHELNNFFVPEELLQMWNPLATSTCNQGF